VIWEASDRLCSKRLKPILPVPLTMKAFFDAIKREYANA
jgi:hypothetical protein